MESLLHAAANAVALALQGVAIAVVAIGSARAVFAIARSVLTSNPGASDQRAEWLG